MVVRVMVVLVMMMTLVLIMTMMRKMQQQGAQFLLEGLRRECRQRPRWDSGEK